LRLASSAATTGADLPPGLHAELRGPTRDIRRGRDLSDPELRRHQDAGDKSDFQRYGIRSMEQTR
jgi:hypothetical protein